MGQTFRCYSCQRQFKWEPVLAGRTIRCHCGVKFKAPRAGDATLTAAESLDDTVADVALEEAFDDLSDPHHDEEERYDVSPADVPTRGAFGLRPAGETLLWGVGVLIGLAFGILAFLVGAWAYVVCAAVFGVSLFKFVNAWKRWTRGRPFMQCLLEALGESEPDGAA